MVGRYTVLGGSNSHSFLLENGAFTEIAVPGAIATRALAINNAGTVIGTYIDASYNQHGFLDVGNMFSDITGAGGVPFLPVGLNDSGQIVGTFGGTGLSYLGTPEEVLRVPEPSSVVLLALGLVVLGMVGLRTPRLAR